MHHYIGVDGGGSTLRVALVDEDMRIIAQAKRGTANPTSIGLSASAQLIADALCEVTADYSPNHVMGVGIGIAGASADYAADWLFEVVKAVLPYALVVPASDIEMALVGAHGRGYGALLLAGTGSIALGIGANGNKAQVGGWGYQLGDEGSGYWIGLQAIQHMLRVSDGRVDAGLSTLAERVLETLQLSTARSVIPWMYHQDVARTREIAQLSQLVLDAADAGDVIASDIIDQAADELALLLQTIIARLPDEDLPSAFAGGLLENENALSIRVCSRLGLSTVPHTKYPPVVGAALMAKLIHEGQTIDAH